MKEVTEKKKGGFRKKNGRSFVFMMNHLQCRTFGEVKGLSKEKDGDGNKISWGWCQSGMCLCCVKERRCDALVKETEVWFFILAPEFVRR